MAMTFDPANSLVTAYLNGVATASIKTDPVAQSVFQYKDPVPCNPFPFHSRIYSPHAFKLKYNGYHIRTSGIFEHWLFIDGENATVTYGKSCPAPQTITDTYKVRFQVKRNGSDLFVGPLEFQAVNNATLNLPKQTRLRTGD